MKRRKEREKNEDKRVTKEYYCNCSWSLRAKFFVVEANSNIQR